MAMTLKETIDERPQPMRMRRAELAALVMKNPKLVELMGGPAKVEEATKDKLLQFTGFQNHLPTTHPLGIEPGDVPYEHWSMDSLKIEAKKRRLSLAWAAKATKAQLIAKILEDDEALMNPPKMELPEGDPDKEQTI